MAVIEHDFGNGLTAKNSAIFADYQKFYQNVYPGNGTLAGAVNPTHTSFNLAAYQHWTNRQNLINQTDFFYKTSTGRCFTRLRSERNSAGRPALTTATPEFLPNGMNTITDDPFNPTFFGPINFVHHSTATNADGVTAADSNSKYTLYTESAYARDTVEITRWLQLIGGARIDRFDMSALDQNTNTNRARVDTKVSPQAAVIVKPIDNLSFYGAYSVSYLPASGDQFSSLNNGTLILDPQKFENKEVGVKWNITPRLLYTAAVYELERTERSAAGPEQCRLLSPNRRNQNSRLRDRPERLCHR